jgi:hypothetical protein
MCYFSQKTSNFCASAIDIVASGKHSLYLGDTCILNMVCARNKFSQIQCGLLPCRWNFQLAMIPHCLSEQQRGPGILHGCGGRFHGGVNISVQGVVTKARNLFNAYYFGVFPCLDRMDCLLKLARQSKMLADTDGFETCDDSFFSGNFTQTELEFSNMPLSNFSRGFHCRIYHNTVGKARWFRTELQRKGALEKLVRWPPELL